MYKRQGRDMPRSMYNHTDVEEDKTKTYLEPDSTELEILQYLNDNFDDVVPVSYTHLVFGVSRSAAAIRLEQLGYLNRKKDYEYRDPLEVWP